MRIKSSFIKANVKDCQSAIDFMYWLMERDTTDSVTVCASVEFMVCKDADSYVISVEDKKLGNYQLAEAKSIVAELINAL